ncbi:hypothetical protein [Planctomicrobium sp. SH664]|uniref:hypothetical protein n=1 Tax=Planctomicrobium sp. SH664 TaxID=3448125 RepID=UPI003F5C3C84
MKQHPLTPRLLRRAGQQLQDEIHLLQRLEQVVVALAECGSFTAGVAAHQGELHELVNLSQVVRQRRDDLRREVSAAWQCGAEQVRMSRIAADPSPLAAGLEDLRQQLASAVTKTFGQLRATQVTLGIWNGVIHSVLQGVLTSAAGPERYSASGQRVIPQNFVGITLRS